MKGLPLLLIVFIIIAGMVPTVDSDLMNMHLLCSEPRYLAMICLQSY